MSIWSNPIGPPVPQYEPGMFTQITYPEPHCAGENGFCGRRAIIKEQWLTERGVAEQWFCEKHRPAKRHKKRRKVAAKKGSAT